MNNIIFRSGKLVGIRKLERSDIGEITKWINSEEVSQYLLMYKPTSLEDELKWFEKISNSQNDEVFALVTLDEMKFIGIIGVHNISWKDRVATTGAIIGDPEYRGKGYGTEGKMLVLDYLFNTLNLRKVCAAVFDFNKASYRYQNKCGYKEEGRRVKQIYKNGEYHDEILTAVFKDDWLHFWRDYKKNL